MKEKKTLNKIRYIWQSNERRSLILYNAWQIVMASCVNINCKISYCFKYIHFSFSDLSKFEVSVFLLRISGFLRLQKLLDIPLIPSPANILDPCVIIHINVVLNFIYIVYSLKWSSQYPQLSYKLHVYIRSFSFIFRFVSVQEK